LVCILKLILSALLVAFLLIRYVDIHQLHLGLFVLSEHGEVLLLQIYAVTRIKINQRDVYNLLGAIQFALQFLVVFVGVVNVLIDLLLEAEILPQHLVRLEDLGVGFRFSVETPIIIITIRKHPVGLRVL
jgi:hypothetical protein